MNRRVMGLVCLVFSVAAAEGWGAVRYSAECGGTYPGVRLLDEAPDCWFSFGEKQATGSVQAPGQFSPRPVAWNVQGQLLEYYATGTHITGGGNQIVTAHLYDPTRNAAGKITGWTEIRHYETSNHWYVFRVSRVNYTGTGQVLCGYDVTFSGSVPGILISGIVSTSTGTGIGGVKVNAQSTGFSSSVHTTSDGYYLIAVPSGWNGTLTPSLENHRFTPASKSYTNLTSHRENQNFTGTLIETVTISGVIQDSGGTGIPGVTMNGFLESVTTNASGVYSGKVEKDSTVEIRPSKACMEFTPEARLYNPINASIVNQDYTATPMKIVPDLKGKTLEQADAAIAAAGLYPGMYYFIFSQTAEYRTVIRQSPAAGECIGAANVVHLAISLGWQPVGMLKAWGNNASNLLSVPAGSNFVSVAAGGAHAVAMKDNGTLAAWGNNTSGQCTIPAGVFESIACGAEFSLGIKTDGTLAAWGKNTDGQITVPTGNTFIAIGAGDKHGLAIRVDGTLAAWGSNAGGQCTVPAGQYFLAADGGEAHTVALTAGYGLQAWGANESGQCNVPDGNDFVAVAAGGKHNLALREDGTLVAWGLNTEGQCEVPAGNTFVAVAAGKSFSAALTLDGTVIAWGKNDRGQCDISENLFFAQADMGADFGVGVYALRGDLNESGSVDIDDLALFVPQWMASQGYSLADLDRNNQVDLGDLAVLGREWMVGVSPIPSGLIAHWKMDDNAANKTVLDAGDHHYNGTAQQNTSILTTVGKLNTALSFNGTTDYIDCGTNAALLPDAWTVCAWIKCIDAATPQLISFGGNYPSIKLQNNGKGKPLIHLGQNNYRYFAASAWTTLKDGQWHHVAFSVPGKEQADIHEGTMYLDGVAVAGDAPLATGAQTAKNHAYLGGNPTVPSQRFGGTMDDVMLFNRVLTESEIWRLMHRQP